MPPTHDCDEDVLRNVLVAKSGAILRRPDVEIHAALTKVLDIGGTLTEEPERQLRRLDTQAREQLRPQAREQGVVATERKGPLELRRHEWPLRRKDQAGAIHESAHLRTQRLCARA